MQQTTSDNDVNDSLDSDIDAVFDDYDASDSGDVVETPSEEKTEESGADEPSDAPQEDSVDQSATLADALTSETKTEDAPAVEAPSDFNAEEAAAFATLPAEAQKLLVGYAQRSQSSRSELSNKLDGLEKSMGPVADAIKPFEAHIGLGEMQHLQRV